MTVRTTRRPLLAAGSAVLLLSGALTACSSATAGTDGADGASPAQDDVVTVYTADGLNDSDAAFYAVVGKKFTEETGIEVEIVEDGSGEVLQRVVQERANPQADLLVTLPPFIQRADAEGLLQPYEPEGADQVPAEDHSPDGTYLPLVNNYIGFIRNTAEVEDAPRTWEDLLAPEWKGRLQYSTPGVAGDGTAMLLLAREVLGDDVWDYMSDLQENNVGPSKSTGQLAAKVDKGELLLANGDVQMNYAQAATMPNLGIFFLDGADGTPTTLSVPYSIGLVEGAPHPAAAQKFYDYLLSPEAQELATTAGGGFPVRSDVVPAGEVADDLAALMEGVTVLHPDWQEISADLDALIDEWSAATGSL